MTVLKNGLVYTSECVFEPLDVSFSGGEIIGVSADISDGDSVIDCMGCYVLPALTDIHLHGCAGHDLSDGTSEALAAMAEYQFAHGIGAFCPAVMTLPADEITRILRAASDYASSAVNRSPDRAELVGINLEGPFLSAEKCGAQDSANLLPPSAEKLREWQSCSGGLIRLVTVAPELDGAERFISERPNGVHVSLGHTACGYERAAAAFAAGADHVTHLYNAMSPFHHRDTGLIGAAFDDGKSFVELICDGVHSTPTAVRTAFKLFGDARMVLISDSVEAAGMPDGEYTLGGQRVIKQGSRAVLANGCTTEGGALAGSVSNLYDCLMKAVEFGIPLESAVRAATKNPCISVGLFDRFGSIEPGKAARFLILNRDDMSIKMVI